MTLIPGDGIGPEISAAVQEIFKAADVSTLSQGMSESKIWASVLEHQYKIASRIGQAITFQ